MTAKTFFIFVVLSSFGGFARADVLPANLILDLQCEASQVVPAQPCGGTNSRQLHLQISTVAGAPNIYQESRSYGGCYPISDQGSGAISEVVMDGQQVTFTLTRQGPAENEIMSGQLDLGTNQLSLNTSKVFWVYRNPAFLKCQSK